ncbi:MAG TPA: archaeal heat shock protein Hsp20 [Nitrososphaeraceae archaeon]|nr:archaeal heat shock protein Hsp20 [Nitrososphaeraceae archaeon]
MSNRDIIPNDWYKRFFSGLSPFGRSNIWISNDLYREFDEMRTEMERVFAGAFKNIENTVPKDLIKEYETPEGGKIREVGPIVYGYSMTIGQDGKPNIREFGNVKSPIAGRGFYYQQQQPSISAEREPLVDVSSTDKEIKVIVEMPGIKKENIKINAYEDSVEITSNHSQRKYHKVVDLPPEADIETVRSTYNNGILEVIFNKKKENKPKGKEIKVE